jgi:hypothetical protein
MPGLHGTAASTSLRHSTFNRGYELGGIGFQRTNAM